MNTWLLWWCEIKMDVRVLWISWLWILIPDRHLIHEFRWYKYVLIYKYNGVNELRKMGDIFVSKYSMKKSQFINIVYDIKCINCHICDYFLLNFWQINNSFTFIGLLQILKWKFWFFCFFIGRFPFSNILVHGRIFSHNHYLNLNHRS